MLTGDYNKRVPYCGVVRCLYQPRTAAIHIKSKHYDHHQ
jgi:hypothetical protein